MFFLFFFMWIRWTLPRFRYDQLMSLGWKLMLPTSLAYILVIAASVLALDALGMRRTFWPFGASLFALNIVLVGVLFFVVDRGRIVSPASDRSSARELQRLRAARVRAQNTPEPVGGD